MISQQFCRRDLKLGFFLIIIVFLKELFWSVLNKLGLTNMDIIRNIYSSKVENNGVFLEYNVFLEEI